MLLPYLCLYGIHLALLLRAETRAFGVAHVSLKGPKVALLTTSCFSSRLPDVLHWDSSKFHNGPRCLVEGGGGEMRVIKCKYVV